jgi:hypothetical protein
MLPMTFVKTVNSGILSLAFAFNLKMRKRMIDPTGEKISGIVYLNVCWNNVEYDDAYNHAKAYDQK